MYTRTAVLSLFLLASSTEARDIPIRKRLFDNKAERRNLKNDPTLDLDRFSRASTRSNVRRGGSTRGFKKVAQSEEQHMDRFLQDEMSFQVTPLPAPGPPVLSPTTGDNFQVVTNEEVLGVQPILYNLALNPPLPIAATNVNPIPSPPPGPQYIPNPGANPAVLRLFSMSMPTLEPVEQEVDDNDQALSMATSEPVEEEDDDNDQNGSNPLPLPNGVTPPGPGPIPSPVPVPVVAPPPPAPIPSPVPVPVSNEVVAPPPPGPIPAPVPVPIANEATPMEVTATSAPTVFKTPAPTKRHKGGQIPFRNKVKKGKQPKSGSKSKSKKGKKR